MGINKKTKEASILIKGRAENPQETIVVKGSQKVKQGLSEKSIVNPQTNKETSRTDKYKALLKNHEPLEQKALTRKEVSHYNQKIRENWDFDLEKRLKRERELFVEILFKENERLL